jgi:hypothetical protein
LLVTQSRHPACRAWQFFRGKTAGLWLLALGGWHIEGNSSFRHYF